MTDDRSRTGASLAIRTNNPFALKSAGEAWNGLAGEENGFYVFESKEYGTRAGLIVLYNGYIQQNLLTPYLLFNKYAPESDGNDVINYAIYIADKLGNGSEPDQGINTPIKRCQWRDVARWIPIYESGDTEYYSYEDVDKGLELVASHPSYSEIYSFFSEECKRPSKLEWVKAKVGGDGLLYKLYLPIIAVALMVASYFIFRKKKR